MDDGSGLIDFQSGCLRDVVSQLGAELAKSSVKIVASWLAREMET
jgi:hypothetical protein